MPATTEVMPPKWRPAGEIPATRIGLGIDDVRSTRSDLDRLTARAIEERTWPRNDEVPHLDPATARAIEEPTLPRAALDVELAPIAHPSSARYELGELLGSGGMGEVYAAYDTHLGREVAIKRLHPDRITRSSLARFLAEARIQGWLDHPAIPSVHELGRDEEGRPFFVMKRLSGITLDEILAARDAATSSHDVPRFTEQQLLRAFVEICLAIEFAHTRGVVHRDLKPANMLLGAFGEVYVLDWGVARVLEDSPPSSTTDRHTIDQVARSAGALGTPGYMAPEQVCDDDVDGRADVYALGCVLFEILVGRRLHPGGYAGMTSALAGLTASPSSVRPDVAPELDALCRRATAVDRTQRVASARALGEAVQRYLDGDRDLTLRRELARAHLERALHATRTLAVGAIGDAPLAMREAGRALALDPTLPGAAELVGRLMIQPSEHTPPAVVAEIEEAEVSDHMRIARMSLGTYAGYACLAPVLLAFGIRDAAYLSALVVIALANVAIASVSLIRRRSVPRMVVALGHAAMFGLLARMFTPFFIAPGVAAVTLMAYAQGPVKRHREILGAAALGLAAVLGVLAAEALGWISATTVVEGGTIRLIPPLDGVDRFPILPALCCYAIVVVVVVIEFTYAMARRSRDARRKLHVQAWQLRQLVSLDEATSPLTRPTRASTGTLRIRRS